MIRKKDKQHDHSQAEEATEESAAEEVCEPLNNESQEQKYESDIKNVVAQLEEEQKKGKEYFEQMLRIQADFENYRKRVNKEKQELHKYANESLLLEMLPILDNFQRALRVLEEHVTPENHKFYEGVEMIYKLLLALIRKNNVQELESVGKPFDPRFHHAIQQRETDEYPENTVIEEVMKGYLLNDRLLRAANVIISKSSSSDSELAGENDIKEPEYTCDDLPGTPDEEIQ